MYCISLYCVLCKSIFDVAVQRLVMSDIVYTGVLEVVFDIVILVIQILLYCVLCEVIFDVIVQRLVK